MLVALGAGDVSPTVLGVLRGGRPGGCRSSATVRPPRGAVVRDSYGFEGAEGDVRDAGQIAAGLLTPQAARMKLLACLGSRNV